MGSNIRRFVKHFTARRRTTDVRTTIFEVPIEIVVLEDESFHILIAAEVNGVAGDLIVDTGASVTVIDRTIFQAEEENQESGREIQSGSVNGHIQNVKVICTDRFKIGSAVFKEMQLAVIDLEYVNEMYGQHLNRKVIGLLGCDFCIKHQVVIDFEKKRLTYRQSGQ